MAIDMDAMLAKIKDRQWALADIDWDAPGAETISDEFRPKLKAFMADLCWIENVGARGFAALAKKAPTPDARRDLPLLPRRGAAARQRRTGADEAVGHARGRRDARTERQHPAGHRVAGQVRRRHAAVDARHRHPDARGRARRRAAEVPARRGRTTRCATRCSRRSTTTSRGTSPSTSRCSNMIGHAKARTAGDRLRRQRRHPGSDHRRDHVRRRCSTGCATTSSTWAWSPSGCTRPMKRFKELGDRGRIHPARADLPVPEAARRHGRQPRQPVPPAGQLDGVGCPTATRGRCCSPIPTLVQGTHPRAGGLTWLTPSLRHADRRRRLHRHRHRDQADPGRRRRLRHPRTRPTASAAPGATTRIPVRRATFRRCCTRSRS